MSHLGPLLLKEERAVFSSPIAYATVAVYLLLMGYTFTAVLFLNRTGDLVRVFFQAAVLFLLIVPVVTMRLFAEEIAPAMAAERAAVTGSAGSRSSPR